LLHRRTGDGSGIGVPRSRKRVTFNRQPPPPTHATRQQSFRGANAGCRPSQQWLSKPVDVGRASRGIVMGHVEACRRFLETRTFNRPNPRPRKRIGPHRRVEEGRALSGHTQSCRVRSSGKTTLRWCYRPSWWINTAYQGSGGARPRRPRAPSRGARTFGQVGGLARWMCFCPSGKSSPFIGAVGHPQEALVAVGSPVHHHVGSTRSGPGGGTSLAW